MIKSDKPGRPIGPEQREIRAQVNGLLTECAKKLTTLERMFLERKQRQQGIISESDCDQIVVLFGSVPLRDWRWTHGLALYRQLHPAWKGD